MAGASAAAAADGWAGIGAWHRSVHVLNATSEAVAWRAQVEALVHVLRARAPAS